MIREGTLKILFLLIGLWPLVETGAQTYTINHDGLERSYILHLPSSYDESQEYPLVFSLHGFGTNGYIQQLLSNFNSIANAEEFIVVYPDGIDFTWNNGYAEPFDSGIDDVGFISALIDTLELNYAVNTSRIYISGMSFGGFMAYRLACELPDKIAAIASVTGSMADSLLFYCDPGRAIPVMQIHGTADSTILYEGNDAELNYPAVENLVDYWVANNSCPTIPETYDFPDLEDEGSTVSSFKYGPCEGNSEVLFFKVFNGGHTWPGSPPLPGFGITNQDINASREIWEFFNRFELAPASAIEPIPLQNPVKVYPNPVHEQLTLQITGDIHINSISITEINGRKIYFRQIEKSSIREAYRVDVADLSPGIYLLKAEHEKGLYSRQFVKK